MIVRFLLLSCLFSFSSSSFAWNTVENGRITMNVYHDETAENIFQTIPGDARLIGNDVELERKTYRKNQGVISCLKFVDKKEIQGYRFNEESFACFIQTDMQGNPFKAEELSLDFINELAQ